MTHLPMMHPALRRLFFVTAAAVICAQSLLADGRNWMKEIPDDAPLSSLAIPGTHDTGALYEDFPGTSTCQNLTLEKQLDAGVRFLDIRCRRVGDSFAIHHGMVFQRMSFDDVLEIVSKFLDENPSETVVMSINEEYAAKDPARSFEETFEEYLKRDPARWYLDEELPTLGAVRGRIVLFRRFAAERTKGIDASRWPDNSTFTEGLIQVQDEFDVKSNDEKWRAVSAMFDEMKQGDRGVLRLNYVSGRQEGMFGIPNIPKVSNDLNARLVDWLERNRQPLSGIVVMDFVTPRMCELVIAQNAQR